MNAGVFRVAVVIKDIERREIAEGQDHAILVDGARHLVQIGVHRLVTTAEPPRLAQEQSLAVDLRAIAGGPRELPVGEAPAAGELGERDALGDLRVQVDLAALPCTHAKKGRRGRGVADFPGGLQAVRPAVSGGHAWFGLPDVGSLKSRGPILVLVACRKSAAVNTDAADGDGQPPGDWGL